MRHELRTQQQHPHHHHHNLLYILLLNVAVDTYASVCCYVVTNSVVLIIYTLICCYIRYVVTWCYVVVKRMLSFCCLVVMACVLPCARFSATRAACRIYHIIYAVEAAGRGQEAVSIATDYERTYCLLSTGQLLFSHNYCRIICTTGTIALQYCSAIP